MVANLTPGITITRAVAAQSRGASEGLAQDQVSTCATKVQLNCATAAQESSGPPKVQGENNAGQASTASKQAGNDHGAKKDEKAKKEKRGAIVAAPLPTSSPALGTRIIPVFGYIFPFNKNDKVTPPSVVGAAGLVTNGGSRALALAAELYVKGGAYQVTGVGLTGHLDYNFYGTGTDAGNAGRKLAIQQGGQVFFGEVLRRIGRKFYFGPRAWVAHSEITPNLSKSDSDHPDIPVLYFDTNVKAFGLRLQRDSRTNRFFATDGTFFDITSNFFYVSPSVGATGGTTGQPAAIQGNNFQFQSYRLDFNKYADVRKGQVLAYNVSLCATFGEAPFYGQCIFGANNELRGYAAGQYIDRFMFATQLEYRVDLPKRFGVAVFGGVGEWPPAWASSITITSCQASGPGRDSF
jgi:Omp85 superfamily domain